MSDTSGTSGPDHMWPDCETTQYQVAIPSEDWIDWKELVPRTVPLYRRIHELILLDIRASGLVKDGGAWDGEDEQMARLLAGRIEHRARRAETAVENDNAERVAEELDEITSLAH